MHFPQVVSTVMSTARATIVTGESVPLMVWGPPGVGKSAAIKSACEQLAEVFKLKGVWEFGDPLPEGDTIDQYFGLIDLRASQMDPVDAGGFPTRDAENDTMRRVLGSWFPHTQRHDLPKYGLVFCDELSSAPNGVQASLYQFMQDRRLYDRAMKPGWATVGAGNRQTDGGVVFKMATPLANRLVHITMESSVDVTTEWGMDSGELPLEMVAFLRFRPELLNTHADHVKKKLDGHAFATERTWHKLAKLEQYLLDKSTWVEVASGLVGAGPAAEYLSYKDVWQSMPSIDGIMLDPANAQVPDDPAVLYAVSTALASRATKDNMDVVVEYIDRIDPPFAVMCMKDTQRRDPTTLSAPAFAKWAAKNAKLLG